MKFKFRRYYLYYWGRCCAFLIYLIPLRVGSAIAGFLGRVGFWVLPKYRSLTIENLRAAFPEKSVSEIRAIAIGVFENIAKVGVELINFPKITAGNLDRFVTTENIGIFDEARTKGRGIIVLTAHFGNWELLAMTIRLKGYPGAAVGRRIYFHKFDAYLNKLRKTAFVNVIDRTESPRRFLKVLRANEILGMLADQDVDSVEGVFVNFFGRGAYTPIGPAVLASVSGASLVPVFIVRKGFRHRFIVEQPITLADTGNKEADIAVNTQAWSDVVEKYIRRYPEQWVWMHRRWKTQPKVN